MRAASKFLLPVLLIAVSLAGTSYLRATRPEVAPEPESEPVWTVRTAAVQYRDHQPMLDLYGELLAGREVIIRSKVAGEVIEASPKLREGGHFAKGNVLLRVDPFDYQAAIDELDAEIAEARARRNELSANRTSEELMLTLDREQLQLVRRDVERFERLSNTSASSEKSLDDARIALSRQNGTVSQREQATIALDAQLAQQDAAIQRLTVAKRRAQRDLAHTTVRAPFAGVIADVGAELGQQLSITDGIARLIDDRSLEIAFQLTDRDFGRLWQSGLVGREVIGRWKLGNMVVDLPATIARVVPTIDPASGGVTVYATIDDDHETIPLRPGAFVEVAMPDRLYENAVELPASALFGKDTVYVVENDRLRAEAVELLAARGDQVLIDTELAEGSAVLASRLAEVAPGLRVKVVE